MSAGIYSGENKKDIFTEESTFEPFRSWTARHGHGEVCIHKNITNEKGAGCKEKSHRRGVHKEIRLGDDVPERYGVDCSEKGEGRGKEVGDGDNPMHSTNVRERGWEANGFSEG